MIQLPADLPVSSPFSALNCLPVPDKLPLIPSNRPVPFKISPAALVIHASFPPGSGS